MKKGLTELVFIIDRSGSMSGLEDDTIGGYNSMIKKQKKEEGYANITTVLFDDDYELLHYRENIKNVEAITEDEYYVRGCTALLDAVGKTINKIDRSQKRLKEEDKAEHIMFVITTDGMENSSSEFTYTKIKKMIENKKEKNGWEFIFLGANIDAIKAAESFGISEERATNYNCDSEGTQLNYEVISDTISSLRSNSEISKDWKKRIEEDFESRRG